LIAERRVLSVAIVEALDVLEEARVRFGSRVVAIAMDELTADPPPA
jgi:hypothetical protein